MPRDIETIVELLKARIPNVQISQLKPTHPADDDGIWFITTPKSLREVQLESSEGECPFLIESNLDDKRFLGQTVGEVVEKVELLLGK